MFLRLDLKRNQNQHVPEAKIAQTSISLKEPKKITNNIPKSNVQLRKKHSPRIEPVRRPYKEKKYSNSSSEDTRDVSSDESSEGSSDSGKIFVVEAIKKKDIDRHGKVFYKVRWRGYSREHDTWEPEEQLQNAKIAIAEYERNRSRMLGGRK